MKIDTWHKLNSVVNFGLLLGIIICTLSKTELLDILIKCGIILLVQISWNLLMIAIPKLIPMPPHQEPK